MGQSPKYLFEIMVGIKTLQTSNDRYLWTFNFSSFRITGAEQDREKEDLYMQLKFPQVLPLDQDIIH